MAEPDFCLACGQPIDAVPTLYTRGDLTYDNVRLIWKCGRKKVVVPPGRGEFVELLMKRRLVQRNSLILRYYESDNPENLVAVQICKVRRDLAKLGSRMKIVTIRAVGFELIDPNDPEEE